MKLLVFSPYYPPHIGGLESHADEFNKYLSQKGMGITVFTPHLPKDALEKETRYGRVNVIHFPAFEIIANYPLPRFWNFRFWKLFFSLFKEDVDIVISRTRFFNTSLLALIYAKIYPHTNFNSVSKSKFIERNKKTEYNKNESFEIGEGVKKIKWIHIEHGSDFVRLSSKFKTGIAKCYDSIFGKLILRKSDLNISISKAVQKFVMKFDKRQSPVIYRGLEFESLDSAEPDIEIKNKYKDKIIIAYLGRLYEWKGVQNSIAAVKSLPQNIKDKIVFLIIGGGEEHSRLKRLSKEEKSIVMLGSMPHEKAIGILKIADIYLHSAGPGGGLSTALLEAMYCGCTVIATPNEGADEVIEDNKNGFLIEKPDSKLISEKLIEVLGKNTAEQKKAAKNFVSQKFNWNSAIEVYQKIFNEITKNENKK